MFHWLRSLLPGGHFARSVALMSGGTASAYVLVFLASPILTRLYVPDDYGVLSVYGSICSVLLVLTAWRYDVAIPVPEDNRIAADLLSLSLCLVLGMSLVLGTAAWMLRHRLADWLEAKALAQFLRLVPFTLLAGGIYAVLQAWAVRRKAFSTIAKTKLYQGVGVVATQLGLGVVAGGPLGLIVGNMVQQGAGIGSLARLVWASDEATRPRLNARSLLTAAYRFRRFPLFASWASVLNTLSAQIPPLFLSSYFGTTTAGLYGLTGQVLWAPMRLIGTAIGQVFFSNASEARVKGTTPQITLLVFRRLLSVVLPVVLLLACAAPEAFAVAFGPKWRTSGEYAQWLCPWLFCVFVASPLSSLVFVMEQQRGELIFQVGLLIGRVSALYAGGQSGSPLLTIVLFGQTSAIIWFVYLLWLLKISGSSPRQGLSALATELSKALPLLAPAVIGKFLIGGSLAVLTGAGLSLAWAAWRFRSQMHHSGTPS